MTGIQGTTDKLIQQTLGLIYTRKIKKSQMQTETGN